MYAYLILNITLKETYKKRKRKTKRLRTMILIADSGSTKTTWVGVEHAKEVFRKDRGGLNPVIQSHDEIEREVEQLAMSVACERMRCRGYLLLWRRL